MNEKIKIIFRENQEIIKQNETIRFVVGAAKLSLEEETGKLKLLDEKGTILSEVDFPTEKIIKNIYYDKETKELVFQFINSQDIKIKIDIIGGVDENDVIKIIDEHFSKTLVNYYQKSETYSQEEINQKISAIPKFKVEVVSALPTSNISLDTIYLKTINGTSPNLYEEYIYVNNVWEKLGTQTVDLTGYAKISDVPTKVSQLTNDSGYLTSIPNEYITETELNNKGYITSSQLPTVNNATLKIQKNGVDVATFSANSSTNTTANIIVPTKVSELTNDSGYLTQHQSLTDYAKKTDIPTNVSQLTNDSGYITKSISDLQNYYKKSETYTQSEINNLITSIPKFEILVVSTLPTTNISSTTVYLVKTSDETNNLYEEWIYVNNVWEMLGTARVNLDGYVQEDDVLEIIDENSIESDFLNIGTSANFDGTSDDQIPTSLAVQKQIDSALGDIESLLEAI